jgi:hypothetical protein
MKLRKFITVLTIAAIMVTATACGSTTKNVLFGTALVGAAGVAWWGATKNGEEGQRREAEQKKERERRAKLAKARAEEREHERLQRIREREAKAAGKAHKNKLLAEYIYKGSCGELRKRFKDVLLREGFSRVRKENSYYVTDWQRSNSGFYRYLYTTKPKQGGCHFEELLVNIDFHQGGSNSEEAKQIRDTLVSEIDPATYKEVEEAAAEVEKKTLEELEAEAVAEESAEEQPATTDANGEEDSESSETDSATEGST